MSGVKKFFYIYFAALILVLTGVGVMGWLGYRLLKESAVFLLFGVLICSALVALTVVLCKRIDRKWLRRLVATLGSALTIVVAVVLLVFFTIMSEFAVPAYYNSFESPGGRVAVVLREYSANEELRAQRPLLNDDGSDFLGLTYAAYPRVAGIFYDSRCPGEGALEIGLHSSAQLMYEWTDENTLHLFIRDPQPGDAGEHSLRLE